MQKAPVDFECVTTTPESTRKLPYLHKCVSTPLQRLSQKTLRAAPLNQPYTLNQGVLPFSSFPEVEILRPSFFAFPAFPSVLSHTVPACIHFRGSSRMKQEYPILFQADRRFR